MNAPPATDEDRAAILREHVPPPLETDELLERYPSVDWHAEWDAGHDVPDWLVGDLLQTGHSAAVFAAAGAGKSLVALELAACIATGTSFAGLDTRQAPVLYVDAENALGDIIDRLKTFGFTPDQLAGWLHLKSFPTLPALDHDAGGDDVLALAEAHGAELVIIDTVARTVKGPEQESDTYRAYARATGRKLKAAGIACWRIDHAGKDVSRGQRGSSAKNDDVDVVWSLERSGGAQSQRWRLRTGTASLKKRSRHGLNELHLERLDPTGLLSRTFRTRPTVETNGKLDVDDVLTLLDDLEVPLDAGRDRAGSALRNAGHQASNRVIGDAVSERKNELPL